jgi:hypothetical protein
MDFTKLDRSEVFGVIAGLVLVGSLFLVWYSLDTGEGVLRDEEADWVCGVGNDSCTGFETFPILRWLLIAAAAAPLILSYIVVRGHQLTWPRGELTAIVGLTAMVLIGYNGFVDRPSPNDIGVSLSYGYFLALLAAIGIFIAGGFRAVESGGGAPRKPPATF